MEMAATHSLVSAVESTEDDPDENNDQHVPSTQECNVTLYSIAAFIAETVNNKQIYRIHDPVTSMYPALRNVMSLCIALPPSSPKL